MRIIILQHIKIEDPGFIKDLMIKDGVELTTIELDKGEKIPKDLSKFDAMFCMGGPMDTWMVREYPWLIDEKKAIYEFVINFEREKDLLQRIKDIMPYINEPIVHNYQGRGNSKKRNNIKMFNISSNNIYITDVKKNNKKSYLHLMNYSAEDKTFEIESNYIEIKKLSIENLANKLIEKIEPSSSGKYSIDFQPHERKVIAIY